MSPNPCHVALLGPMWVAPDLGWSDLGPPKQRVLLAVLALHADAVVTQDALADALWEGRPPRTAGHSVQLYVSALRRVLGAVESSVTLETHHRGYRLALAPELVDIHRFRSLVEEGVGEVGRAQWQQGAEHLTAALALWRGPPLTEFETSEFAAGPARWANEQRLDALESLSSAHLHLGDPTTAIRSASAVVTVDPLRERARGVLMESLYRVGRTAEALRTYEDFRRVLDDELGAVPSVEVRALHERILRHDEELLPAPRPPSTTPGRNLSRDLTRDEAPYGPSTSVPTPAQATTAPLHREQAHRRPKRRRAAVAGALAILVAVVGLVVAATGDELVRPGPAVLLHYGDGEVGMLIEAGFDRAVADFDLVGKEVIAEGDNAALTIDEQVTPGALLLDFTLETDLMAAARRHRDVKFVALDDAATAGERNIASVHFDTHEAAYLAGFAASKVSRTGTIGFIGGVDYATIWPFEAGFVAGARGADQQTRVLVRYLSSPPRYGEGFLAPEAGQKAALQMYQQDADVVFAAAGTSGLGVFEAATSQSTPERRLWAVGVDGDQYETIASLPGTVDVTGWRRHILTSVVVRFDKAVYAAVAAHARGTFTPGVHRYNLANGGVELSYSGGYLNGIQDELEAVRRDIVSGALRVPCRPTRLAAVTDPC